MAFGRLRRFDVQANYACVLSLVAIVPSVGAVILMLRNWRLDVRQIIYDPESMYAPALFACLLSSMALAALGFIFGWSSAGQRRNDRPARSWIGFFVGGTILTLNLIQLVAFVMLRLKQTT